MEKIKKIIPGFIVAAVIALIGSIFGHFVPSLGGASFAIFLGIILGNLFFKGEKYDKGFDFSEKDLLSYSIVLMGGTIQLGNIAELGFKGVLFIVLQMTGTMFIAYLIGRKLKFSKKYSLLMASGNSVCGSSAIAATAPVIKAESKDRVISVTIVNITGTILMFVLPIICHFAYNNDLMKSSAMLGGILQSVGQVIGSAQFLGDDFVTQATIFKIIRIIFIAVVVLIYGRLNVEEGNVKERDAEAEAAIDQAEKKKFKINIPWYITGFFILCVINSLNLLPGVLQSTFKSISHVCEIVALAGIGLKVKFSDLKKEGPKALLYGGIVGVVQIVLALIFIAVLINY